jgi:hypothetical protein
LPIKLLTRSGQIYLARTDVDPKTKKVLAAKPIDQYRIDAAAASLVPPVGQVATPITSNEVSVRFAKEKHQAAK